MKTNDGRNVPRPQLDADTVDALMVQANDDDIRTRHQALQRLGWSQIPEAQRLIESRLHCDTSPRVRMICAHALKHFDNEEACAALIQALDDPYDGVAENAVISLDTNHSDRAKVALLQVLQTGRWGMRLVACAGYVRDEIFFQDLLTTLHQLYESPERLAYEERMSKTGDPSDWFNVREMTEKVRSHLEKSASVTKAV